MSRMDGAAPVPVADKLLLSPSEAAGLTGLGRKRALELIHRGPERGGWRSLRVGVKYLVPRQALDEWIAAELTRQAAG